MPITIAVFRPKYIFLFFLLCIHQTEGIFWLYSIEFCINILCYTFLYCDEHVLLCIKFALSYTRFKKSQMIIVELDTLKICWYSVTCDCSLQKLVVMVGERKSKEIKINFCVACVNIFRNLFIEMNWTMIR